MSAGGFGKIVPRIGGEKKLTESTVSVYEDVNYESVKIWF